MIHTENFMLIDKERQIRGFYDGTDKNEIKKTTIRHRNFKKFKLITIIFTHEKTIFLLHYHLWA